MLRCGHGCFVIYGASVGLGLFGYLGLVGRCYCVVWVSCVGCWFGYGLLGYIALGFPGGVVA